MPVPDVPSFQLGKEFGNNGPSGAEPARYRYGCFEDFGEDTQAYGYAANVGLSRSCEDDVVAQLLELRAPCR